jgi:hypothetical protein
MKITHHITFFYLEQRIPFINRIIEEVNTYGHTVDIFIHTNKDVSTDIFTKLTVGTLTIICHDLSGIHPYKLSWKCRDLLSKQKDDYDYFIYGEDDILIPSKTLDYYISNNEPFVDQGCNLGFVRVEQNNGQEYPVDINKPLNKSVANDSIEYAINDVNCYCACWIYSKKEFNRFVSSNYYDLSILTGGDIYSRESSAFGLTSQFGGGVVGWYKCILIPIENEELSDACKVIHMDTKYSIKQINEGRSILFKDIFRR